MTVADTIKMSLRRRTVLASAVAIAGLAGAAIIRAEPYPGPVDLDVVDRDTGRTLPIWRHGGRLFVAGQPGARYSLRVANRTDRRVLAVMSVDGVNILTGETAGYDQRGYVFDPYESYDVSGWRKSDTEVADFAFAALPNSYAARTGRPQNVGVIGIAVFNERPVYESPPPEASAGSSSPDTPDSPAPSRAEPPPADLAAPEPAPPPPAMAPMQRAAPPSDEVSSMIVTARRRDERLGTAHGEREWSTVDTVSFDRATSYPQYVRQIEYDTYDNLVARGVIPPYRSPEPRPRPFPSDPDSGGYVPDPPDDP